MVAYISFSILECSQTLQYMQIKIIFIRIAKIKPIKNACSCNPPYKTLHLLHSLLDCMLSSYDQKRSGYIERKKKEANNEEWTERVG